jgi:site-specific recombinase XerD
MTKLREDFIAYLQLLGHSPKTIKDYVNGVSQLAQHYNKSPLELTPQEVREFLLHIRNVRKLAVRTYNNYFYSIKKFYEHFLPKISFMGDLRRMREPVHQPIVLSKEDVLTLIDSAANLKIKAAIALFYASGIRVEECSLLKMSCIDRKRMVIRIELGKGATHRLMTKWPRQSPPVVLNVWEVISINVNRVRILYHFITPVIIAIAPAASRLPVRIG